MAGRGILQPKPREIFPGGEGPQRQPEPAILTPEPVGAVGVVGNHLRYAREDHVHAGTSGGGDGGTGAAHQGRLRLLPLDADARHTCVSGTATSLTKLSPTDSYLSTLGRVYPGGATDDNNTQWEVPVPVTMDPNVTANQVLIRLHVLIPTALEVPPGGSEGGGTQSGYFSVLGNGDPASTEVVFYQGEPVEVWREWPT